MACFCYRNSIKHLFICFLYFFQLLSLPV
uniref:Predicted protein n=1 Tax=Hordeum vulgare subsp. vulgare TaxID=112509 RepID=F2EG76_HORVV|nr:predicted protein [Hordeum vulgare subsp. vulgare]